MKRGRSGPAAAQRCEHTAVASPPTPQFTNTCVAVVPAPASCCIISSASTVYPSKILRGTVS